jgi:hypothetical protein
MATGRGGSGEVTLSPPHPSKISSCPSPDSLDGAILFPILDPVGFGFSMGPMMTGAMVGWGLASAGVAVGGRASTPRSAWSFERLRVAPLPVDGASSDLRKGGDWSRGTRRATLLPCG